MSAPDIIRVAVGKRGVVTRKPKRHHPAIKPRDISGRRWFALRVESQAEFAAQDILAGRGLMTFVPVRKEWRFKSKYDKKAGKKQLMTYPEMPGYVFAGFSDGQIMNGETNWSSLFDVPIINGVVGTDGGAVAVSLKCMHDIARRWANGLQRPDHEAYQRTHCEFAVGDSVRICSGPFDGHVVPVVALDKGRARVRMELFGSDQSVEIDSFDLERAA